MYSKNDIVVYGRTGVCSIEDIKKKSFSIKSRYENLCYVLKPLYDESSTVYVPVDNERLTSMMRRVLTKNEIDSMIEKVRADNLEWIDDQRERTETFKHILANGIRKDLLVMIRTLSLHKEHLAQNGKKLCSSDDGILKDAKREVSQEFAYALGIDQSGVEPYILERLN